jgi:hypothetical protein
VDITKLALVGTKFNAVKQDLGKLESGFFPRNRKLKARAISALHLELYLAALEFTAVRQNVGDGLPTHPQQRIARLHPCPLGWGIGFNSGNVGWVKRGQHLYTVLD